MSRTDAQYEEILRHALHAAADGIVPAGDGLERIRARLTVPHPLPVAWMVAAYMVVSRTVLGWLELTTDFARARVGPAWESVASRDRKSTRLNSSHLGI